MSSGAASSLTEAGARAQPFDHAPPSRVGERVKDAVE